MLKFDIVIPTWNSMPEFETCLESIQKNLPEDSVGEMIVVDRKSGDGTQEVAKKYGCTILYDTTSLGSARMKGWKHAKNNTLLFVDSDIAITEDWFNQIKHFWHHDVGMLFGRTVDTGKYGKIKEYKIKRDFNQKVRRLLKEGDRGFTHNTFIRKKLLKGLDISEYNAWEDWIITQHILEQGYFVIETKYRVKHIHPDIKSAKVGWNIQGILKVKKSFPYAFAFWNYYLYEGLRSTVYFKDLDMLKWGILNWLDGFKAFTTKNAR